MSPDYLLSNFDQRPMQFDYDSKVWNFDKQKYINQLIRDGFELYPSLKSKLKMIKILKQSGIIVSPAPRHELCEDERIVRYLNYMTKPEPSMRITKKALTTVATWAEMHKRQIILGDIPWGLKRYNILQDNHLLDLKDMSKEAMFTAHRKDISNHEAMLEHHPDFILHNTDEYMATLIQEIADQKPEM